MKCKINHIKQYYCYWNKLLKGIILIGVLFIPYQQFLKGQPGVFDTTLIITQQNILFLSDSSSLKAENRDKLKSFVRRDSVYIFRITGHTDSEGGNEYNLRLSEKRAASVANFLTDSLHIRPDRITLEYKGESSPIAPNIDSKGKTINRRVAVEQVLPLKMRRLHGQLFSDSEQAIQNGIVYIQARYHRDSTITDDLGKFIINVPDKSFIRLHATGHNHFYLDSLIRIRPGISRDTLFMTLPYLKADQRYNLPEMLFVGNKDILLERSMSSLSALTQTMINSDVCAIIEGHVNRPNQSPQKPGTFSFNLSVARAQKIKNHLLSKNIDSTRMNAIGYSNWYMKYPYAKTDLDQELNRRVEMVIVHCDSLFNFTQEDIIIPDKIGTTKRLIRDKY